MLALVSVFRRGRRGRVLAVVKLEEGRLLAGTRREGWGPGGKLAKLREAGCSFRGPICITATVPARLGDPGGHTCGQQ